MRPYSIAPEERPSRYVAKAVRDAASASGECIYCGTTIGPMEFDHMVPHSAGGPSDEGNIVLSCQTCNRAKADGPVFRSRVHALRAGAAYLLRRAERCFREADRLEQAICLAENTLRGGVIGGIEEALVHHLPTVVTVPATQDDEDEFRHIPAELATPSHWREHLEKVLRPQRDGLNGSIAAIAELLERAEACPQDAALIPWLSRRNDPAKPPDPRKGTY